MKTSLPNPTPLAPPLPSDKDPNISKKETHLVQHANDPTETSAFRRLVGDSVPRDELVSLIEEIFPGDPGKNPAVIDQLESDDAQAFIDVIDKVRYAAYWVTPLLHPIS